MSLLANATWKKVKLTMSIHAQAVEMGMRIERSRKRMRHRVRQRRKTWDPYRELDDLNEQYPVDPKRAVRGEWSRDWTWTWAIPGEVIELREGFQEPVRYNKESVLNTLATVRRNRHEYATQEAHERRVEIYEHGAAMFI